MLPVNNFIIIILAPAASLCIMNRTSVANVSCHTVRVSYSFSNLLLKFNTLLKRTPVFIFLILFFFLFFLILFFFLFFLILFFFLFFRIICHRFKSSKEVADKRFMIIIFHNFRFQI